MIMSSFIYILIWYLARRDRRIAAIKEVHDELDSELRLEKAASL